MPRISISSLLADLAPAPPPIARLPPELLVRVFLLDDVLYHASWETGRFATPPRYALTRAWVRRSLELSHVCRRWRAVTRGVRALWDAPVFKYGDGALDFALLDRAAGAPLKLDISCMDEAPTAKGSAWFARMAARMPAAQSLAVFAHEAYVRALLAHAPALQALRIKSGWPLSLARGAFHAPALETLSIPTGIAFPPGLLARVTRLELEGGARVEDLRDVAEILRALAHTPALVELCVFFPGRDPWIRGDPPVHTLGDGPDPETPHLATVTLRGNYTLSTALYRRLHPAGRPLTVTFDDGRRHVHDGEGRALRALLREYTSRAEYKPVAVRMTTSETEDMKRASVELIPADPARKLVLSATSTEFQDWGFQDRFLDVVHAIQREHVRTLDVASPYKFASPLSFNNIATALGTLAEIRVACPARLDSFLALLGTLHHGRCTLEHLTAVTIAGAIIAVSPSAGRRAWQQQECTLERLVAPFAARHRAGKPVRRVVLEDCDFGEAGEDVIRDALAEWVDVVEVQWF
jgi:hypothetical protein